MKFGRSPKIWKGKYRKALVLGILIMVLAVTFWIGLRVVLKTEVPLLAVNSTSMYPALNYGDLIVIQGIANVSEITVAPAPLGDIVVFRRLNKPDALIISRVIDKTFENDAWYIHTRFDTQDLPDMWLHGVNSKETWERGVFHEEFLVGRVVSRIPFLGYIPL